MAPKYQDGDWLREQYEDEGRGTPSIASECGVAPSVVYYWLGRHGIKPRDHSTAAKLMWEDEEYAETISETRRGERNPMYGMTGENNPWYSGGYDGGWRQTQRWKRMRRLVYERADHRCESCDRTGAVLHAHHIIPVVDGGEKYDLENLVCLCVGCHQDEHGRGV